jgi:DNA-binding MarR family transcriptional regulator
MNLDEMNLDEMNLDEMNLDEMNLDEPPELILNSIELDSVDDEEESLTVPYQQEVYEYLQHQPEARPLEIQSALGIKRSDVEDAWQALTAKGLAIPQNNLKKQASYRTHLSEE